MPLDALGLSDICQHENNNQPANCPATVADFRHQPGESVRVPDRKGGKLGDDASRTKEFPP